MSAIINYFFRYETHDLQAKVSLHGKWEFHPVLILLCLRRPFVSQYFRPDDGFPRFLHRMDGIIGITVRRLRGRWRRRGYFFRRGCTWGSRKLVNYFGRQLFRSMVSIRSSPTLRDGHCIFVNLFFRQRGVKLIVGAFFALFLSCPTILMMMKPAINRNCNMSSILFLIYLSPKVIK